MSAEETIRRFETLQRVPPTPAQLDELIAALASTDGTEEYIDETPGWSGPPVGRTVVREVAAVAQSVLGIHSAVTLLPLARAYRQLPSPARERVRDILKDVRPETWAGMPAQARAEIIDALSQLPTGAPDADDISRTHALLLWQHRILLTAERRDDQGAIPLILEGLTSGDSKQEWLASKLAARFAPSEPLAGAIASNLLQSPLSAVSPWAAAALEAMGMKPPKAVIGRMAEALEQPRSSHHEWSLLCALEPYASDTERLDARGRDILTGVLARLCLTTSNEGHFSWAIKMVGRDEVGRKLAPLLAERLHGDDERSLVDALRRVEFFGPAVATLLPRIIELLESEASPRQRHATLKAIQGMGASAAPAVPALLRLLEKSADDTAVSALGAIGPAAAPAVEKIRKLQASAGQNQRMRIIATSALEKITGEPRSK